MRKIVIYINEFPFNKEESFLYKKMFNNYDIDFIKIPYNCLMRYKR